MTRAKKRQTSAPADPWAQAHEPVPEGDDWVECGGELIWAMGFTEGGAPYGLGVSQFRAISHANAPRPGWARAKWVLQNLLEAWAGPDSIAEVGWVKKLGEGLSREVFGAEVEIHAQGRTRTVRTWSRCPRATRTPGWTSVRTRSCACSAGSRASRCRFACPR